MYERDSSRKYNSGRNYQLEFGNLTHTFNEKDFTQRCEQAARELSIIDEYLSDEELEELIEFILQDGNLENPKKRRDRCSF